MFLLRPRVVVYTSPKEDVHYNAVKSYGAPQQAVSAAPASAASYEAARPAGVAYEGKNILSVPTPAPKEIPAPLPVGEPVPLGSVSPDLMDPSGG